MSKIPPLTTLRTEDYPAEERAWLPKLFGPLNQFLTAVTNTINGRVDFGANIPCVDRQIDFVYDGIARRIPWNIAIPPRVVWVGQASEDTDSIAVIPSWSYSASSGIVAIDFIKADGSELTVGNSYKIFVRVAP